LIHANLKPVLDRFQNYMELRSQINRSQSVYLVKGGLISNTQSEKGGVSARAYRNGVFGFASAPETDEAALMAVANAANDNACFLAERERADKGQLPKVPEGFVELENREKKIPQKILLDKAKELDGYIAEKYPRLSSRFVSASILNIEKLGVTGGSAGIHSIWNRAGLYAGMTVEDKDGKPCDLTVINCDKGFFDELYGDLSIVYEEIDRAYEHLMKKAEGVYAQAGIKDCILSPVLTGMLSHEAVGHTVEADLVIGGSVAGHMIGKEVASEKVTMVDFAHHYGDKELQIPVYVDDEGTTAGDALLIDRGILKGYMHNKVSADKFGTAPTGNARAFAFSDEPLIRMRNTAVLPGNDRVEDMIASIEDGYYLMDTNNGQADTTGEFMFGVTCGYEIKNGKLGRAIKNTTISGVAFEMLKTVDMVGNDLEWCCAGMCGKKQSIPVSMGGPSIKCKVKIGGR